MTSTCSFTGCGKPMYARKYCNGHYVQINEGRTLAPLQKRGVSTPSDVQKRLFAKRRVDPKTGCWLWTGSKTRDGYGQIQFNGQIQRVHRVAYERLIGEIGEETLHHKCAVRLCFNPEHLQPCSSRENIAEMRERQYYGRKIENLTMTITDLESRLSSYI